MAALSGVKGAIGDSHWGSLINFYWCLVKNKEMSQRPNNKGSMK
jgi:hypothetical protein